MLAPLVICNLFRKDLVYISALALIIPLIVQIVNREPYPWYFVPLLGIISLFTNYFYLQVAAIVFSFMEVFQYAPYLLLGVYTTEVAEIKTYIFYISLYIIFICVFLYKIKTRR